MAALILLAVIVGGGLVLYINHRLRYGRGGDGELAGGSAEEHGHDEEPEVCCGQHAVCDKFSEPLGPAAVYYDDEQLDRYAGRRADQYSDDEIEEFRDVLLTLLPSDLVGWGRSIEQRGIVMPQTIRDEYLMLLGEA